MNPSAIMAIHKQEFDGDDLVDIEEDDMEPDDADLRELEEELGREDNN